MIKDRSRYENAPDGKLKPDAFKHEIAMLINDKGKNVFISGTIIEV